jgi:hypothetical protein
MRLILSRKGFDSSSGGCPSPVFPDGSMLALPIPDKSSTIRYEQLSWKGRNLGDLVQELSRGRQKKTFQAHLDPDLRQDLLPRLPGWRPTLGQEGASQSHLKNQGVSAGDLFLFWGLFQRVGDDLRCVGPPFHALWGWLQVACAADVPADILPALASEEWRWASAHPHVTVRSGQKGRKLPNYLYVAADSVSLPSGSRSCVSGAGVFERFRPELQLSANPAEGLSRWSLPGWFAPGERPPLTYHSNPSRWRAQGDRVLLQTVGRGQEFVLNLDYYPEAVNWLRLLLPE